MMTLKYLRAEDLPAPGGIGVGPADLSPLLGTWFNTNPDTRHIIKWVVPHADSVASKTAVAFRAVYDFGFMQLSLAANYNKGIIIIAAYSTFKDGSPRSNYFTREFFYHESELPRS